MPVFINSCLRLLLLILAASPAFSQVIASKVYAWNQAPVVNYRGYEERTILEGTTRDFASLTVHAITLFANQPAQPNQTLEEEALVIVRQGELTLTLVGKTKTLGPGSAVLIMPGDLHQFANKTTGPVTYYVVRYSSNEMPDLDLTQLAGGSFWVDWNQVPFQPHDKGGIRRMLDCGTVMVRRLEMHITTLNAGLWSHSPHIHRPAEMLLMMDNTAQVSIDGLLQPTVAGDVIFLEANVPHGLQNTSQGPCTYVAFQLKPL